MSWSHGKVKWHFSDENISPEASHRSATVHSTGIFFLIYSFAENQICDLHPLYA